ncbi:MAG TPA: YafY family protein [Telluria sp.]|jgi:predicted DNA-binding transcriptional regulator YafY
MSRTNRLFLLLDALRGHRRPVTAAVLAGRLGVSERTIYRDIQTLSELGAPVQGEAGVGFMMRAGLFLPPLMFSTDELEALVLGARWVRRQGDDALADAASNALAKIATATPKDLRDCIAETSLWVPVGPGTPETTVFVRPAREAIRDQHKLRIGYRDAGGAVTERTVWPFALAFFEGARVLAAWCELRGANRHFRIDRIASAACGGERYPAHRRDLLKRWRDELRLDDDS